MFEHSLVITAKIDDQISEAIGSAATAMSRVSTLEIENPGKDFGRPMSSTESEKTASAVPLRSPMLPERSDAAFRPGTKRSGSVTETARPISAAEPVTSSFELFASVKLPAARSWFAPASAESS
jgi:hypothetical protein